MNCLVTGGAGFIGSHVVDALVARGDRVRVFDNLSTGRLENLKGVEESIEFVEGDICDYGQIHAAMDNVDVVFHQAAIASVPLSLERPFAVHEAGANGTLNALEAARKNNVPRFVYAASSSCYGNQPYSANRETDPVQPLSPYAAAKLCGEMYCQAYFHSFGMETVGLRYFNIFGPRQDPDSPYSAVIPIFLTRILSGRSPIIFGDGYQSRDFCYVGNVAQCNLRAAEASGVGGRMFNVGTGRSVSLLELLEQLGKLAGTRFQTDHEPPREGDVRFSTADINSTMRELGYDPSIDFETGLRKSIDYYRALIPV